MKKLITSFILTIIVIVGYAQTLTSIDGITFLTGFWKFNIGEYYKENADLTHLKTNSDGGEFYKYTGTYIPSISKYKVYGLYLTYDKFNSLDEILIDLDILGNWNQHIVGNTVKYTVYGDECNDLYDYFDNLFNKTSINANYTDMLLFRWKFVNSSANLSLLTEETKLTKVLFAIIQQHY